MKTYQRTIVTVAAVFVLGLLVGRGLDRAPATAPAQPDDEAAVRFWTCSMHPQIQQPGPGLCPLCAMELVAVTEDAGEELGPREIRLSERAAALAEVAVVPVERRFVERKVRLVGKVEYDETRLGTITAWVPGRLDRLFIDYTGVTVQEGDHMVRLYSPDLLAAQQELIQAAGSANLAQTASERARVRAESTLTAAREKLRLWGLTDDQIQNIEQTESFSDTITVYSPISGVVIHKNALEGDYVDTGSRIYTIADLSTVWVKLDAYESDLAWLRYGQEVEFTAEALPGQTFHGTISFIDPILNPVTRTVKVRVIVDNPDGLLKPEMFVRAFVKSRMGQGGRVLVPDLAGKWISPMHPEIVKDAPGTCDVCGMDLVSAESLGYVDTGSGDKAPLVIPASAALVTGKRAVVYVRDPERRGVYEGREVVLGPRADDYYLVMQGLSEGEQVVHRGNFKIDSAIQIQAKPSMMNPDDGGPAPGHHPAHEPGSAAATPNPFRTELADVFDAYLDVGTGMVSNQANDVRSAGDRVIESLARIDRTLPDGDAPEAWLAQLDKMVTAAKKLAAEDIETVRIGYSELSELFITAIERGGPLTTGDTYVVFCPMAFNDQGANWLQDQPTVSNPYFSGGMPLCGVVKETIAGVGEGSP